MPRPPLPRMNQDPEAGIILLTVIMMIIILSLIVIGFMSTSVSQVKSSQTVIDRLKAEELALGVFYQYHQRLLDNSTATAPASEQLDGKTFTIAAPTQSTGGLNATNSVTISVTY